MSRFNRPAVKAAVFSPVAAEATPSGRTFEGAPGHARDAKGELFLLAVSNFVSTDAFYEKAGARDERFEALVRQVAAEDPDWLGRFIPWLRSEANMRTASLVAAAEAVKARLESVGEEHHALAGRNRKLIDAACQRADEPGEMLAYWTSRYGRAIPKPVKRGVADAAARLYTGKSLLKYDTASHGYRFGDVIDLVHPAPHPDKPWQGDLFAYALTRRHHPDSAVPPESNRTLAANRALLALPVAERRALLGRPDAAERLAEAGFTWEMLAGWLQGPMDAQAWSAVIPSMGYMACLAEGTPVWLADGTTAPIEEVVARRLPVLSYDKAWDTRPVKYGPNQEPRDHSVGSLVPTVPSAWLDTGVRDVAAVRFASGRVIEATYDHRWVRQRRRGRQAWEWTTTAELQTGDRIPVPLTADAFGDEGDVWDGYFVGAMLGDGGMTSLTPEFHADPDDGAAEFMREYAAKHNCGVWEYQNGAIVRMRFPFQRWTRNPLAEVLRRYDVWGKRCEVKALPNRPFSREFWIGALSGLIDTDGCVRERINPKGTLHGSVEYATVSRRLAVQVSDALLRLGVTCIVRERTPRSQPASAIQSRHPIYIVEVNRATAIVRLAQLLDLRIRNKAVRLASLAERLAHVAPAYSEMHGYDEAVALDRVVAIEEAGQRATYCVTVDASNLFVANGLVTGNCLRNLRNFDQAGVSDLAVASVIAKLADPAEVARSRQFPFRFYAAHKNTGSLRWGHALEKALRASLGNVPSLPGRTLVLIDQSPSMFPGYYYSTPNTSDIALAEKAALFGSALALRAADADLVGYGFANYRVRYGRGDAVLEVMKRFHVEDGTDTPRAMVENFKGHDRVVIVTDEQTAYTQIGRTVDNAVPANVPVYTWNLGGYKQGHAPSGSRYRHTFGGLTDQGFKMIPLLEAGQSQSWPF